jgi:O-antigen ligase
MEVAWSMIVANPLLGVGLNNYTLAAKAYDATAERVTLFFNAPVHNLYLFILAEVGILGLAAFLWLVLVVLGRGVALSRSADPEISRIALGLVMGLAAFLIHGLVDFDFIWRNPTFWFIAALVVAAGRCARMGGHSALCWGVSVR